MGSEIGLQSGHISNWCLVCGDISQKLLHCKSLKSEAQPCHNGWWLHRLIVDTKYAATEYMHIRTSDSADTVNEGAIGADIEVRLWGQREDRTRVEFNINLRNKITTASHYQTTLASEIIKTQTTDSNDACVTWQQGMCSQRWSSKNCVKSKEIR